MAKGYRRRLTGGANPNFKGGISLTPLYKLAKNKEWRRRNRDAVSTINRNAKAVRRNARGRITASEIRELMKLQRGRCVICRRDIRSRFHLDHVTPVTNGGDNTISNAQLLCPTCNMRKGSKDPIVFMQSQGFLL